MQRERVVDMAPAVNGHQCGVAVVGYSGFYGPEQPHVNSRWIQYQKTATFLPTVLVAI